MPLLRFVCLLIFLSTFGEMSRPVRGQSNPSAPFAFIRQGRRKIRLPMQLQRNLLIIKAMLNGAGPFNFLLDTGVSTSILTASNLADSLHLRHGQQFRVVGAGGRESGMLAYQTDSVRVTMSGVEAPNMTWLVLSDDMLNLSGYVGMPIHGIIGAELFNSFVVTLQPELNQLQLNDPASFRAPHGKLWTTIPLSLENNKAYLTAPVQVTDSLMLPLKLVLDTGASHALSLELDSDPRLVAPTKRLTSDLGRGLTGTIYGFLGRVGSIQLGRHTLRSVLTSFPNTADVHRRIDVPRNGNVGYELLKRFSLIIDYPHKRLLLRPNPQLRTPFEHDMCGIELLATGPNYRRYLILRVVPDSPAAAAGLEAEEELLSINFIPVEVYTLTQIDRILHSEDGRGLLIVLRRPDGSLHTTTVRLKRQI